MADSSVAITAGSGTPIRVLTALGSGSADQQVTTPANQYGNFLDGIVVTGTLTALNATIDGTTVLDGYSSIRLEVYGTFTSTVQFQQSNDGTTWTSKTMVQPANLFGTFVTATSAANYVAAIEQRFFRVQATSFSSGTVNIAISYTSAATDGRTVLLAPGSAIVGSINNVGQITGSITPGNGLGNLGKAAANTPTTTDTGVAILLVRAPTTPVARTATAGNYSQALVDAEGKQIVQQYADPANTWQSALTLTTTTASAASAAQAAGIRNYVTGATFSNSAATATLVQILDGASTVIWQAQLAASQTAFYVAFETPLRGTAATALNVKLGTAVTSVFASLQGFIGV